MKYNVLVYLDSCSSPGLKRLRLCVRWQNVRFKCDVGFNVDPSKWDSSFSRVKKNSSHGKDKVSSAVINAAIQRYEDAARRVMDSFDIVPSRDEFKARFLAAVNPQSVSESAVKLHRSFFDDWDEFVSEQGNACGWSEATYKKMTTMRHHLAAWRSDLDYSCFDEAGLLELQNVFVKSGKKNGTIARYLKNVRWFLRWAVHKGYCTCPVEVDYRPHLKDVKKRVIFLTWSELMAVYNCTFAKDESRLEAARDKFCFSCFTGLRYSDVVALNKCDVSDSAIYLTTQKTHDPLRIELNKYSKALVDKYATSDGSLLFPKISNQKMNQYLKLVGKKCGLDSVITEASYIGGRRIEESHKKWELLTTHCGRRTFICNALMLGIPADVVMKWTGHSDYKAMRPYIDIADETKKVAMALFDER